jgi:hypothetical protein
METFHIITIRFRNAHLCLFVRFVVSSGWRRDMCSANNKTFTYGQKTTHIRVYGHNPFPIIYIYIHGLVYKSMYTLQTYR